MAKYSRFDPRNKNRGKHKSASLEKEFRIREVNNDDDSKRLLNEVMYDDQYDYDDLDNQRLHG
jgi:hypothetical protein